METIKKEENKVFTPEFLAGGGEMGKRIREFDWSATSLGPVEEWPQSLRTCIRIMLNSRQPIWIGWGKELIKFYNDPYLHCRGKTSLGTWQTCLCGMERYLERYRAHVAAGNGKR